MLVYMMIAPLNERSNRRWSRIQDRNLVTLDNLPEPVFSWPIRRAFIYDLRRSRSKRTIYNITVASNPTAICSTPINVLFAMIEDQFERVSSIEW